MNSDALYGRPAEWAADVVTRINQEATAGAGRLTSAIEQLLDVAFFASLLVEEGRSVAVSLAYAPVQLAPPPAVRPFAQALALAPGAIRKIAAGLDAQRSKLAVRHGTDGTLEVWGLIHAGSGVDPMQPHLKFEYAGGGELTVTAFAAGSLDVTWCGEPLLAVRAGRRIPLTVTESADITLVVGGALKRRCPAANDLTVHWLGGALLHVLRASAAQRHGGTLLITEHAPMLSYNRSFVFAAPDDELRRAVDACVATNSDPFDSPERVRALNALQEASEYVAGLAAIDGAVVLSPSLEICAFGSMIAVSTVDSLIRVFQHSAFERGAPERLVELKSAGGARHQSAAAWCAQNVSSDFAIVCSHDGGAAVAMNAGNGSARMYTHLFLAGR